MSDSGPTVENSRFCTFILFVTMFSIAPSVDFLLTSLNPLIPVMKEIYNETYYTRNHEHLPEDIWYALMSVTMSILLVGAFIGSLLLKTMLDHMTRKQLMLLTHACNIVGNIIIILGVTLAGSYEALIIGRFILGFVLGFGMSLLPIIVSETCVPHKRQLYGAIQGTCYSLGSFIGPLIGWSKLLGTRDRYFIVFIVGMIPSITYFSVAYWIPNTPYQAFVKGGEEETKKVLRKLRSGDQGDLASEMEALAGENKCEVEGKMVKAATLMEVMKNGQYRRHFIAIVILYCYIMTSGLNHIFFYSDQVFLSAGLSVEVVTPASIGVFLLGVIVAGIAVFTVDCIEPRFIIIFVSITMIIGHILMTASLATFTTAPAMSVVAIVAMCLYYSGFVVTNIIIFTMVAALSIEKTRPICTNFGGAACWFFAWFVGFMAAYFQLWIGAYAFLVWMASTVLVTLYIIFFVPNTRGKSSEEIQEFFKDKQN